MAGLVPVDDLPSGIVPESDLPEVGRKTPKQMRERGIMDDPRIQGVFEGLRKLDEAIYEAGGRVTDVGAKIGLPPEVSAGAGYLTNVGLNAIPSMFPGGSATKAVPLKDVVKMGTLADARALGLNVPPSAVGSGAVERGIESLGGKADIAREMSSRNREAIQIAARRAAGVPENVPLTPEALAAARIPFYKPYEEISKVSTRAREALTRLRQAREDAKGYWREFNQQGTMASKKEAQRLDSQAEAYEKLIDREAIKAGRPDLLPALKQARVSLAKNADVERAMIPGSGEIDARAIGRTLKRRGEAGMTDELQTIGKFAQNFPDFVQPKAAATDVSALKPYAALLAGAGGYGVSEHYSGSPYGAVLGALPFISPAARSLALSKAMQSGALAPGASAGRVGAASLIPLSRIGKEDED